MSESLLRVARAAAHQSPDLAARGIVTYAGFTRRFDPPARERDWMVGARRSDVWGRAGRIARWTFAPLGDARRGTALLVHGWNGRGSQLGAFVEPLRRAGYRVVAFDGRGHGRSWGRRSTIRLHAEDIASVAAAEGGEVTLVVAHSMGCASTSLAIDRGSLSAERIVYVAPPRDPTGWLDSTFSRLGLSHEVFVPRVREQMERHFGRSIDSMLHERLVSTFDAPLLVIHDRDDGWVPLESGQTVADGAPRGRLLITEGHGHHRILREPDVVASVLAFAEESPVRKGWSAMAPIDEEALRVELAYGRA